MGFCRLLAVVLLWALVIPISGLAQEKAGAQILIMLPSARAYGMGETGVADPGDPANSHFNPGLIPFSEGLFLTGSYGKLVPQLASDVWTGNIGAGAGVPLMSSTDGPNVRGGAGISYGRLNFGEWEGRDENNIYLGQFTSSEYYLSLTLGGSVALKKMVHLGAGISVTPLWINLASREATTEGTAGKGSTVAFDVGLIAMLEVPGLPNGVRIAPSIGFSALNLGADIKFENTDQAAALPRNYRMGIGFRAESPSAKDIDDMLGTRVPIGAVSVNFDIIEDEVHELKSLDYWGAGTELALLQALFLRYGYVFDDIGNIEGSTFGVGLGLKLQKIWGRIDFASVPQPQELDRVEKFGFSGGFVF